MRELERVFKGLGDATRLRILNLLLHGELCVCDIQYVLESAQPTISRHLIYLKSSGLVLDRREGPRIYYRLADPAEPLQRRLFDLLRFAFSGTGQFGNDSRKLKKAIQTGSCTVSEWRPFSAMPKANPGGIHRE